MRYMIEPLDPRPRRQIQLAGEHGVARRNFNSALLKQVRLNMSGLVVQASRRRNVLVKPVKHDVGEHLIFAHDLPEVSLMVGPAMKLFQYPSEQPRRGVIQPVSQRLRLAALDGLIAHAINHF